MSKNILKTSLPEPSELWQRLIEIDPERNQNGDIPDIQMLGVSFRKHFSTEKNQKTKELFELALNNWDDNQVIIFIKLLTENEYTTSQSIEALRNNLKQVYKEIFESK